MSLTVDVLPFEPLPVVRVVVSVGASASWKVTGRAGESEWLAGEGTGPMVFSDPWAPLGVPATYTLTATSGGPWESGPVIRNWRGQNVITDLSGRRVVDFAWHPSPGNPRTYEPRASFAEPWGSPFATATTAPVAGAGSAEMAIRTVPPYSRVMEELVTANRPLLVHHSHSWGRCAVGDCDIEPVQTVLLTKVVQDRRRRADVSERVWDLSYRFQPRPYRFLAPVVTWADVLEHWPTAAALAGSGLTNADLLRGDWAVDW